MKINKILAPLILWYLAFWAKVSLFKIRPKIIGVGGASGKTSLSHFLKLILSEKYSARETAGKNSQTGIPLSILGIRLAGYSSWDWFLAILKSPLKALFDFTKYQIFIAELGIDSPFPPNNMSYLLKIVRPQVAVLTSIGFEHSENFEPLVMNLRGKEKEKKILELTAKEEGLLLTLLPRDAVAVINIDDPKINELRGRIKANVISVSTKDSKADFYGEVSIDTGFKLVIKKDEKNYVFKLSSPVPLHFATTILEAFAISQALGIKLLESIKILRKKFSLPPGRFSVFQGIKNTRILDSSYNSSLVPSLDALFALSKFKGRKVAVMGDMRELGSVSKTQHEILATKILQTTDLAILIGPLMKKYVFPILKKNNHNLYSFLTFSESKSTIKKVIKNGDTILVKGSQNTLFLERVVEILLKDKKDKVRLARRGEFWDKKRKETP